jgi:hypothetical protein
MNKIKGIKQRLEERLSFYTWTTKNFNDEDILYLLRELATISADRDDLIKERAELLAELDLLRGEC